MKKIVLLSVMIFSYFLFLSGNALSQISGTKTIPGNYPTIAAAIAALNTNGVGAGGVTFNIAAGHTETITSTLTLTATGTVTNQIVFQKSGTGNNPLIKAYSGGTATDSTAIQDGIWSLIGSDYVTINAIDLLDTNSTKPATMEYGFGLFKASQTNGCWNNTIKNCVVTLNRNYVSRAIFVVNNLATDQNTLLVITDPSGSNSYNKFYSNILQQCNTGIFIYGYNPNGPYTQADYGNDIGGNSAGTGNTIINFGCNDSTITAYGISCKYQYDFNVSYNTINNNNGAGISHLGDLYGIDIGPSFSVNFDITHNNISLHGGALGSSITCISNSSGSSTANVTYNVINANGTGTVIAINNLASPVLLNINYNQISELTTTGSSPIYGIYNYWGNSATRNYMGNTISDITGGVGGIIAIYDGGYNTAYIRNNIIDSITRSSITNSSAISLIYFCNYDPNNLGNFSIDSNTISHITNTGSGEINGIYAKNAYVTNNDNHVYSLTSTGGGSIYGIRTYWCQTKNYYNHVHHLLSFGGSQANKVIGFNMSYIGHSFSNNIIHDIVNESTGASITSGICVDAGGLEIYIKKNKIFKISGVTNTGFAIGIYIISPSSSDKDTLENNFVGDIHSLSSNNPNAVQGVYLGKGIWYIYNNTVFLNDNPTGTLFGSSALNILTAATSYSINNILINTSMPIGSGITAAYRRSSTTLTSYNTTSNNNYYNAGTPGPNNLIFYDGTHAFQTLQDFQSLVTPRDSASKTSAVLPTFLSMNGNDPTYLHLDGNVGSVIESGGQMLTTCTDDFDGDIRAGSAGYPIQLSAGGTAPDIGADEFDGWPFIYTNIVENQTEIINIFPNPATNNIYIDGLTTTATAEVYDISGKLLLSKQLNTKQIDISGLAIGLYFIKLSTAEGSVVRRFVKQ